MMQNFVDGGAAVNQLCRTFDADLRVYELALEHPTADFTAGPAMSGADCARAMAYGLMAVEPNLDVLWLGEMGISTTPAEAALACARYGGEDEDGVGRSTGVAGMALDTNSRRARASAQTGKRR